MIIRAIQESEKTAYNAAVTHPLQSYEWGIFRSQTHTDVERIGIFDQAKIQNAFQLTFHPVPHTSYTVGYFPKGKMPDEQVMSLLKDIGIKKNAIFIKMEPDVAADATVQNGFGEIRTFLANHGCVEGKPLFTRYSFQLSLIPSEEELLAKMHQKTRYNINLATKKGVTIIEDTTEAGLQEYLTLLAETTKRQQFYAHTEEYYKKMFSTLAPSGMLHIFKAMLDGKALSVWIVFVLNKKIYYPYGASSREHREVMANNLLAWEVIKFGKSQGCELFDMWGSLGPNPNDKDPWYGFHKFKEGYGGTLVEFVGSYDLVLNPTWYKIFQFVDTWRWRLLHLKSKLF